MKLGVLIPVKQEDRLELEASLGCAVRPTADRVLSLCSSERAKQRVGLSLVMGSLSEMST